MTELAATERVLPEIRRTARRVVDARSQTIGVAWSWHNSNSQSQRLDGFSFCNLLPRPYNETMEAEANTFVNGSVWLRGDFHLHTKADKEFSCGGEQNSFAGEYVDRLKKAGIGVGVITNHNKFDLDEFKSLRRKARKEGIGLLPGVELSVSDGSNGIHTLVVFSDDWIADGEDHINQFLGNAFAGRAKSQYEQENGRTNYNLVETLKTLEDYRRDFFIVFAHVENDSGLWHELEGGRLQELAEHPLIAKYCLGFQKVRTHEKPDAKCRVKVKQWWPHYPAEVEGSDPKKLDEIGKGEVCFLKLGDSSFDAVKFALKDFPFRVATSRPAIPHSHVDAIRFEGGLLDGTRIPFSPHLNCLIGIRGSGKSSVLECLRYALDIPFGDKVEDEKYKSDLIPYVLKSGGRVIVEATDRHGTHYEIHRILNHSPDVFVAGVLKPGVSIRETIVAKPLYFGQKDLSAAGKGFGQGLVEKMVGEVLKAIRQKIAAEASSLRAATKALIAVQADEDRKAEAEDALKDVIYRLEQFDKYKLKDKLEKQVEVERDLRVVDNVVEVAQEWEADFRSVIEDSADRIAALTVPESKENASFFKGFSKRIDRLKKTIPDARAVLETIGRIRSELVADNTALNTDAAARKNEFAETQRELVRALTDQGVTSIQPDAYVQLTTRKAQLVKQISDLGKRTAKAKTRHDAVASGMTSLNKAWLEEYKQIETALAKINADQTTLKVTAVFKGDKAAFQARIEEVCRGSGIRKEAYEALSTTYADFAEIYKDIDAAAALTKGKADTFRDRILSNLEELLTCKVPHTFDVTYHGRPLTSHSLGQRASAMILFLLSQDENDLLLIDQPEDDLDSQTVYNEVVKLVRDIKVRRQFIFATHNANFPVLGDAEIVAACSADEGKIEVASASIDRRACQTHIVGIMEGGTEAFQRRKTIYELWHA